MWIFDKIKSIFTKNSQKTQEYNELLRFLGISDVDNDELSEATYFACLKVLSESVGKLPLKLMQHEPNNGVITRRDHPLYYVLRERPNKYMTATTFWSTIEFNRNHYGNAFVLIDGYGKNLQLWVLPSNQVEIWYDDQKIWGDMPDVYYLYSHGGKIYRFGSEEVLHFKSSNSFDGITGVSVRDQLKQTIRSGNRAQRLLNRLLKNGFTAKAVLQYTASLNDENAKKFAAGIEAFAKGDFADEGVESIIPIPLGATLTPLNINLGDNQFVELKQYTALQIASAFGIKPNQIGDYTKSSYASSEAQNLAFYTDTLLYILKQYEEEITYKLLSRDEIAIGIFAKFNVAVILRADLKTQIDTLSTAVNSFIYTPNEARAILDLVAKEGGDELLGNGASIPVRFAGRQYVDSLNERG